MKTPFLQAQQKPQETSPQHPGVVSLHVNAFYFSITARRVISPTWGPPPPCKKRPLRLLLPLQLRSLSRGVPSSHLGKDERLILGHMYLFMKASRVVLRGDWFREEPLT